jgi:type I restriction-modification system DNA methylase subunit
MLDSRLLTLQESLLALEESRSIEGSKQVVRAVLGLLVADVDKAEFRLFRDGDGKLTANGSWFYHDDEIADRRATYAMELPPESNLDVKVFGLAKPNMRNISWVVGLTPNFEDEQFNGKFNVGLDFVIPESKDRVILALSSNYVIRTIELKGQLTATFLEILGSWLQIKDTTRKRELHTLLWNSLDLRPINKKFYEGISHRFVTLRRHIEESGQLDGSQSAQFTNRLIGRIIFTWFLDKKELLDTTQNYFQSEIFEDDSIYYRTRLESLFFEVLNTPIPNRSGSDMTTPYLNGGLFEPKKSDLANADGPTFPRHFFDDFFAFLRSYNFTTDESTSEFQQVAIDPEMLGRIFENLLAEVAEDTGEQARKAKGAFYTPREVVDQMCKDALRSFLRGDVSIDPDRDYRLYQLIDASERSFQDQDHNWRRDLKPYKNKIMESLDELKVLDPACGSGAFPIGMLQLLVKVYSRLEPRLDFHKVKLKIIEKNIYGVDIDPMAVEISRLRSWLALIVDLDPKSQLVPPLPNLDFKFIRANSLVPLEPVTQMAFFEDEELDQKLQLLRDQYFKTESTKQKFKLRDRYRDIVEREISLFGESPRTRQLRSFMPFEGDSIAQFFDPEQMFGFKKFDVVLGNPPYVRQEKISYKPLLKNYEVFTSTADLYTYFFERACNLLRAGGVVSLITSSKFGRAVYGEKLRHYLSNETTIDYVIDHQGAKQFAASVNTWIVQARNIRPSVGHLVKIKLTQSGQNLLTRQDDFGSAAWRFIQEEERVLFSSLAERFPCLSEASVLVKRGITTGCTEAFVVDSEIVGSLVTKDPSISEIIFKVLRGRDIGRYSTKFADRWLIVAKNSISIRDQYPDLYEYLEKVDMRLDGRVRSRSDQGKFWTNLRDCAYYQKIESEKIIWSELSTNGRFSRSSCDEYILDTAYMLETNEIEYYLGILNSSLVLAYMSQAASRLGANGIRWKRHIVDQIPIPAIADSDPETVETLRKLVIQRESCHPGESLRIEEEIDEIVFTLYRLTPLEIQIVNNPSKSALA